MGAAETLALKLILTPVLVGAASLAGRRWGSEIGGWLVGIPFTSAPVAFFLALGPGPRFAATAAVGIMAATASQAAFCLAYAWVAQRRGWGPSLLIATAGFLVVTALLDLVVLSAPLTFVAMVLVLVACLALMPGREVTASPPVAFPRWDLPARMAAATAFVIVLTGMAPLLGPRLAGLLAPFPLYATVLAAFAHRVHGAAPAVGTLRGLLLGLFSFAAFFLMLSALLVGHGIAVAFTAAVVVALALQGLSLAVGRRLRIA
ncbi:hypothetical protein EPN29_06010 [bacterium]|nr:MAG: hypothetical protein EPN29_06010 [bacterium]